MAANVRLETESVAPRPARHDGHALLLDARNLRVAYGSLVALDNANFVVRAGQILGVIGPNGAGKSTTYAALTNRVSRSGTVSYDGASIDTLKPHQFATVGIKRTFQQNSFFSEITVLENMICAIQDSATSNLWTSFTRPWVEMRNRAVAEARARALLQDFNLPDDFLDRFPHEIPYGTQRILSIAMAYGNGARILMLDEPAAGIGGNDMQALIAILAQLKARGVGMIVIEHHMDLIMQLADEIVVLDRGRQIAMGTPLEIQANPAVREAYLGKEQ
jgi:branched-chain amino acid transport system ATP-binding protein